MTLIRPNFTPDHTKFILRTDMINLGLPDVVLRGPFEFASITSSNRTKNLVASVDWQKVHSVYQSLNIIALTIGALKKFSATPSLKTHRVHKWKCQWCRDAVSRGVRWLISSALRWPICKDYCSIHLLISRYSRSNNRCSHPVCRHTSKTLYCVNRQVWPWCVDAVSHSVLRLVVVALRLPIVTYSCSENRC